MKKDFRVLSEVRCTEPDCTKKLKQNLIDRNPDADKCFKHYPNARRNRCKSKAVSN